MWEEDNSKLWDLHELGIFLNLPAALVSKAQFKPFLDVLKYLSVFHLSQNHDMCKSRKLFDGDLKLT